MTNIETQVKYANEAEGKLHLGDGYFCHECRNKGLVYFARENELVARLCKCRPIRKSLKMIEESGLSSLLEKKTFDNYFDTEEWQKNTKNACLRFVEQSENRCLYIGGQCGSGKTHLCTAMCKAYLDKGKETRYFVWPKEIKVLKAMTNESGYLEYLNQFLSAEVLYIDDFFKQREGTEPTAADVHIAFEIFNTRMHDPQKITIISSELTYGKAVRIDQGTLSRVAEMAGPYILCIEEDKRKNYRMRSSMA